MMGRFSKRFEVEKIKLNAQQLEAIERGEKLSFLRGRVVVELTVQGRHLPEPPDIGVDDFEQGDYTRVDSVEKLKVSEVYKENDRLRLENKAMREKLLNVAEAITNG